jgi:hypothetical protein
MSQGPTHDVSIGEHGGHIKGRPISWIVVVMVAGGFLTGGLGLVLDVQGLFLVGIGAVVVGGILGWITHAMADVTARVETAARRANAPHDAAHRSPTEPARNSVRN